MDKQPNKTTTTKSKFLKLLPKAASIVNFQNPPFSPGRDNHNHHNITNNNYNTNLNFFKPKSHLGNHHKAYSGPIVSIIPSEARTRPRSKNKNGTTLDDDDDDTSEPTSPKVSCIGQIKHHHKHKNKNKNSIKKANPSTNNNNDKPARQFKSKSFSHKADEIKSRRSSFKRMFAMGKLGKRSSDDIDVGVRVGGVPVSSSSDNVDDDIQREGGSGGGAAAAPSLGQMKRFSCSRHRDGYGSFDWMAQIAPEEDDDQEEEGEVIVPFSAPMVLGGGEVDLKPRKEVNLWKRRTMAPPTPLQLQQQHKRS